MKTLFLSDLHLEDARPEAFDWMLAFIEGPARDAAAVYILGDLFEYWIGDDAASQTARTLAGATRDLADRGVPIGFIHGNRDFLLGPTYAARAGFDLLPETFNLDLYGTPTVLLHGDTLCTDDVAYQAVRAQTRDPAWQSHVLSMSIEERLEMARSARDASMAHTGNTAADIMDVNPEAVLDAFAASGARLMIHGHTHRPATHDVPLEDGTIAQRVVLADWYDHGSYLEVSPRGIRSRDL
ncbi:MAG: UDP-2,3-diacylglucosamine diphosphatase [Xanthomonadales bacterium]